MIHAIHTSKFRRSACNFMAVLGLVMGIPSNLYAYDPLKPREAKKKELPKVESRALSEKEMDEMKGKWLGNPYYAGQAKFDVVFKGVNMRTGNFSTSATDFNFEGGYGIPVNVTRSYSANSIDEGPFGVGWTLSADLRSTAGGLLKSGKSPSRSVPVQMKRRPTMEQDPNIVSQPSEAVVVTDADGKETTIQRDVDGILTTPPWDKNEYDAEYEHVVQGGAIYWVLKSNKTMTPDGIVYEYEKKGSYVNGSKPWDDNTATAEPSNILKPTAATDRHGNTTNYVYGSTDVQFAKSNGLVNEKPLLEVNMPNGRDIEFVWTGNRVTQIKAVSNGETRAVNYTYDTNGQLATATTPGGKTTTYGYGSNLMQSITDPRGLQTTITYSNQIYVNGIYYDLDWYYTDEITEPNGRVTEFEYNFAGLNTWGSYRIEGNADNPDLRGVVKYSTITGGGVRVVQELDLHGFLDTTQDNPGWVDNTQAYEQAITQKIYAPYSYDLTEELVGANKSNQINANPAAVTYGSLTKKTTSYNFLGNPLTEITREYADPVGMTDITNAVLRTITTEYAYWGEDKYFQQKAVKVTAGSTTRYSYTDYYDSQATMGKRGQTYRVYDNKHANFTNDTNAVVPAYAQGTSHEWKYRLIPSDPTKYSGQFDYDSKGRPLQVWKLQTVNGSTYNYVRTDSTYGSDGAPAYGNATSVSEDAAGSFPRVTQTLEFDIMGRAIRTMDGMSREFRTNYDGDGQVDSIEQKVSGTWTPVVTYTYGTTSGTVENGQPLTITDELSGVEQTITYVQNGAAKGSPLTITEDVDTNQTSTTTYSYDSLGQKSTSTLVTPNGTTRYKYSGFGYRGATIEPQPIFTTINKQEYVGGNWVNSAEEVRYKFDALGRMMEAQFALTPQGSNTNYDSTNSPYSYVSAIYDYDNAGRTESVEHYWNELVSGSYAKEAIRASSAAYTHDMGLKTSTTFKSRLTAGSSSWAVDRTEEYGYDADFDYLTGVDYNDGLSNEVQTWTYDAAGNRASASATPGTWTYDNLNRMSASPFATYTHNDIGNRIQKVEGSNTTSYSWDAINRLKAVSVNGTEKAYYVYRADGMRVKKVDEPNNKSEEIFYDGQFPIQHIEKTGSTVDKVVTNFVGVRGMEAIETITSSSTNVVYPLYDTHGNMVATLNSTGTGWTIGNERHYDVWGSVRQGSVTGGPKGRYVANLGHVQDDESGLTYMRARYYEPQTGRFISEDPDMDGSNWYIYCNNVSTVHNDFTGKSFDIIQFLKGYIGFKIADWLTGKAIDALTKGLGQFLQVLGKNLIKSGRRDVIQGIAEYNVGSAFGSLGASISGTAHGLMHAARGFGKVGVGITLLYIGRFLEWYVDFEALDFMKDIMKK